MKWPSVSYFFLPAFLVFCNASAVRRSHLLADLAEEQPRKMAYNPQRGAAGRPLALAGAEGRPLVRRVVASADSKTEVGEPLNLWVNVTDNANTIKSCTWKSPDDVLFPVQPVGQASPGGECMAAFCVKSMQAIELSPSYFYRPT